MRMLRRLFIRSIKILFLRYGRPRWRKRMRRCGERSKKLQRTEETRATLEKITKYKPSLHSAAFNSGADERIVKMVEMTVDPLEPPKFKHKRVPKASGSPPVTVVLSPPRPVTVQDQQDWKIPPCISNWKNLKGNSIPLDKRLAADGRGLQEVQKAREAVAMRSKVQKEMEMLMKEKDRKEHELRALAAKARSERTCTVGPPASPKNEMDNVEIRDHDGVREKNKGAPKERREERDDRLRREKIREERKREMEWERRLEAKDAVGKKSKITRDRDRDISEKVALGMASTGPGQGVEVLYDQRLFNQEKGMGSGFVNDDQVFAGTSEKAGRRDRLVEFEKDVEEAYPIDPADPFGF
ncbi:hypothetical protein ACFE04_012361 [Oxalis oulophora]